MTEPEKPKKRSFFKKAAWQTKKDTDDEKEHDIFSHSNEFKDIVAEENKRKQEQRRLREEEKKRKVEEKQDRKRRKISLELEEGQTPESAPQEDRKDIKARSRTPLSPVPVTDNASSLSARYDSLTKPPPQPLRSEIIDLGDSDDEDTSSPYEPPNTSVPLYPSRPTAYDDPEEVEDPVLAGLAAQARARAANKYGSTQNGYATPDRDARNDKIVSLFISSAIPNTKPLIIKIRASSTLEKPRSAWCQMMKFTPEFTRKVFFTWKHKKVLDSTTVKRLGIHIDDSGTVTVEGTSEIYDDENLPKVHVEAWTEELFDQWKKEQAEEAAAKKRKAETPPPAPEPEPVEVPQPVQAKIRLILKAKGRPDFKITVKPDTSIEHLTYACRKHYGLPDNQSVTLMFDGERLRPMDTVADTDIEDMECVEVYFK